MCRCCDCCDCNCCDNDRDTSESLLDFLDANNHPDSVKLAEFLKFFRDFNDPNIRDPSWYTRERLMDKFNELRVFNNL